MKTIQFILTLVCFLMLNTMVTANNKPSAKKTETEQIKGYLQQMEFGKLQAKLTKVDIHFMINDRNELVIMNTNNPELDAMIKSSLNYKALTVSELSYNTLYIMPVNVVVKN
jgi:hypothetical protein